MAMNRDECLLKLLAIEPETRERIALVTGWPPGESDQVLDGLIAERRVTYGNGPHPTGQRLFYPTHTFNPFRDRPVESRLVRLARVSESERQRRQALRHPI